MGSLGLRADGGEQGEDSSVAAPRRVPLLAYGLKRVESLVGLNWTGLSRESSQIIQHIKWSFYVFAIILWKYTQIKIYQN